MLSEPCQVVYCLCFLYPHNLLGIKKEEKYEWIAVELLFGSVKILCSERNFWEVSSKQYYYTVNSEYMSSIVTHHDNVLVCW